jgi:phasin
MTIPNDVREITAKSVEEARKAFESFIDAAKKATSHAEETASALQTGAKEPSTKALSFTEANVKAAFDHTMKLIHASNPQEMLNHQAEFVKTQLTAIEAHAKEIGSAILKKVTPEK